jgi:hypothetical protein
MKKRAYVICSVIIILFSSYSFAGTWTTLDYPGAANSYAVGINGNNIVGWYSDNSNSNHSFLYDGTNWASIDHPGSAYTYAYGISGNNIVGYWNDSSNDSSNDRGFIYDGKNWTALNYQGAISTHPKGISGSKIVGSYSSSLGSSHGFIYDSSGWTTLDYPGSMSTFLTGISGNNIVGYYRDSSFFSHGFIYDGTNWTILSYVLPKGIDGSYIVDGKVLYNINTQNWSYLKYPVAELTNAYGINGNSIVGYYRNGDPFSFPPNLSAPHGFVYTIPEPATLFLFGLGAAIFRRKR